MSHTNIDPALLGALRLNDDFWKIGDPSVKITTESGAIYFVNSNGEVTGGSRNITEIEKAQLSGSMYRVGGPIRAGVIVYGLCMEIIRKRNGTIPNLVCTSPVVKIENANGEG